MLLGELRIAISIVESILGAPDTPARLVLEPIKRIMAAAARKQDLEAGDMTISLSLSRPAELFDSRVVVLYAELLAGLEVRPTVSRPAAVVRTLMSTLLARLQTPDIERGIAFCNLAAELEQDAFGPFLAALKRTHGASGVSRAVSALQERVIVEQGEGGAPGALSSAASPQGLLFALRALHDLGSPSAYDLFCITMKVLGVEGGPGKVDPATFLSGVTQGLPGAELGSPLLQEAFAIRVEHLLQRGSVLDAAASLAWGVRSGAGPLEEATLRVCRDLLDRVDDFSSSGRQSAAVATARLPPLYLSLLVRALLYVGGRAGAAHPHTKFRHLLQRLLASLIHYGRLDDALMLVRKLFEGASRVALVRVANGQLQPPPTPPPHPPLPHPPTLFPVH